MSDLKARTRQIFKDVFEKPGFDFELIKKHFHPDYIQHVDGKVLNFDQFVSHVKVLKSTLSDALITFDTLVQEGDTVCSAHRPSGKKSEGDAVEAKVIAVLKFKGEQLIYCDELTHIIQGEQHDKDLGSRL